MLNSKTNYFHSTYTHSPVQFKVHPNSHITSIFYQITPLSNNCISTGALLTTQLMSYCYIFLLMILTMMTVHYFS